MTTVSAAVNPTLHADVQDFLFREAEILDEQDYTTWLAEFVAEDIRYQVPVQVTRERSAALGSVSKMMHIDDDWKTLEVRALRLRTEYFWAEDPPTRTRHFVSNVRVGSTVEDGDEINVRSNLLLYRSRGDRPTYDLISAARHDVLRPTPDGWRLARRLVVLDQSVILTHSLTILF